MNATVRYIVRFFVLVAIAGALGVFVYVVGTTVMGAAFAHLLPQP